MTEFISSQRGETKMLHEGYIYSKHRADRIKTIWRCEKYQSYDKCRSRAISLNSVEVEVVVLAEHNHDPNPTLCEKAKWMETLKKEAKNSTESTRKISLRLLAAAPESVLAHVPFLESMQKTVLRARKGRYKGTTSVCQIKPKMKMLAEQKYVEIKNEKLEDSE
ncbi:uncharacterized protein LOC129912162 [Episyrphus balteatus]|uniref:uncharacterized protein LOC129912162 n=1 Tax=Episyrphus balteatus TaxID=286459 RepID=UPI002486ADAA|nr:uncharacterized protein LOC129912162 [Episyrphus balteatus]XP_055846272.1 uncharacterized protein LOC129912162 [Episyrphus balteatus]